MAINADKTAEWKDDIAKSVDFYNQWFLNFAPRTYRETRQKTILQVEKALETTRRLVGLGPHVLREHPSVLSVLRMVTAPPIARDRLIGLSGVTPSAVHSLEQGRLPQKMSENEITTLLDAISHIILQLLDKDIFPWVEEGRTPNDEEFYRASTVVADRLCGAMSDPLIRNAQEQRQLAAIQKWLENKGYTQYEGPTLADVTLFPPGQFSFRMNIPVKLPQGKKTVNIPMDVVVKPKTGQLKRMPLLIEAKSAGDFTNTNKRRKEEAVKAAQLKHTYGKEAGLLLFLCGYFDSGYLGYEAAEGIDWIWEHRIDDLTETGL